MEIDFTTEGLPSLGSLKPSQKDGRPYVLLDNNQLISYGFLLSYVSPGAGFVTSFNLTNAINFGVPVKLKRMRSAYYVNGAASGPTTQIPHYTDATNNPTAGVRPAISSIGTVTSNLGAVQDLAATERFFQGGTGYPSDTEFFGTYEAIKFSVSPMSNFAVILNDILNWLCYFSIEKIKV